MWVLGTKHGFLCLKRRSRIQLQYSNLIDRDSTPLTRSPGGGQGASVYIFQGMMLANGQCNHESYIGVNHENAKLA